MKDCELDEKTPRWFRLWANNHYWHLKLEVRWHSWALGLILAVVLGKLIMDFFW